MATVPQVIDSLITELESSQSIPDSVTYLDERADFLGSDGNITIPVIEFQTLSVDNLNRFNSERVGFTTDASGNQTGEIYHAEYTAVLEITVMAVEGQTDSSEDIASLIQAVRDELYQYTSIGPDEQFNDDVWKFQLIDAQRADDLQRTPTLRIWQQDVQCWAYEVFETESEFIEAVSSPDGNQFPQT